MEFKFINTENLVSLYFVCSDSNKVSFERFLNYRYYLQYKFCKNKWDLTCDKHDIKYICEEFKDVFAFDNKTIFCMKDKEFLKEHFISKTPKTFLEDTYQATKKYCELKSLKKRVNDGRVM